MGSLHNCIDVHTWWKYTKSTKMEHFSWSIFQKCSKHGLSIMPYSKSLAGRKSLEEHNNWMPHGICQQRLSKPRGSCPTPLNIPPIWAEGGRSRQSLCASPHPVRGSGSSQYACLLTLHRVQDGPDGEVGSCGGVAAVVLRTLPGFLPESLRLTLIAEIWCMADFLVSRV